MPGHFDAAIARSFSLSALVSSVDSATMRATCAATASGLELSGTLRLLIVPITLCSFFMNKHLEWGIAAVILALMMMAELRLVFYGMFEPFDLAAAVALIILACVVCQHAGKIFTKDAPGVFRVKIYDEAVTSFARWSVSFASSSVASHFVSSMAFLET
jgi:hypothetical protein